jgi:hypothetical protein
MQERMGSSDNQNGETQGVYGLQDNIISRDKKKNI